MFLHTGSSIWPHRKLHQNRIWHTPIIRWWVERRLWSIIMDRWLCRIGAKALTQMVWTTTSSSKWRRGKVASEWGKPLASRPIHPSITNQLPAQKKWRERPRGGQKQRIERKKIGWRSTKSSSASFPISSLKFLRDLTSIQTANSAITARASMSHKMWFRERRNINRRVKKARRHQWTTKQLTKKLNSSTWAENSCHVTHCSSRVFTLPSRRNSRPRSVSVSLIINTKN